MTPGNEPDPFTEPQPAGTPESRQSLDHRGELRSEVTQNGTMESAPVRNAPSGAASEVPVKSAWQGRLLGISFAIFAFEIGLFLVIFPWMGDSWDLNYFQSLSPVFQNVWDEPYFRGAISGLGFLNIYIAMLQIARLFRRST
jgi:hypothetical protein